MVRRNNKLNLKLTHFLKDDIVTILVPQQNRAPLKAINLLLLTYKIVAVSKHKPTRYTLQTEWGTLRRKFSANVLQKLPNTTSFVLHNNAKKIISIAKAAQFSREKWQEAESIIVRSV